MTRPALSELHSIRRSMQKRLAFYMITLAILLAATLVAGLFFFDQLKSPREGMVTSLNFRMEAFASDMAVPVAECLRHGRPSVGGHDRPHRGTDCRRFPPSAETPMPMEALQETMLEPLCQYGRQVDCSGAFVLLNSSLGGDGSCGGLYIQREQLRPHGQRLPALPGHGGRRAAAPCDAPPEVGAGVCAGGVPGPCRASAHGVRPH